MYDSGKSDPVMRKFLSTTAQGIASGLYLYAAARLGYVRESLLLLVFLGVPIAYLIGRKRREHRC